MSPKFLALALLSYGFLLLVASSLLVALPRINLHRFAPIQQQDQSTAGAAAIESSALLGNRRKLLEARPETAKGTLSFRANLVRHRAAINATKTELFFDAVRRSKARAKALASGMMKSSKITATRLDFKSPVASISGAYTMEIEVGTPPQKFKAIMDTGSDLVWIQCQECVQCYKQDDPIFKPTTSSTFSKTSCTTSSCKSLPVSACSKSSNTCVYGYQYGDSSSTQGDFALETLTLRSTDGSSRGFSNFQFGCGRLNSGSFGGAAGIVGLGQGSISLSTQLASAIGNKFAYCLVEFDSSKTSPLVLGASASAPGGVSTPIIPNSARSTYYFVGLEGVVVGGTQLSLATKTIQFQQRGSSLQTRALEVNGGGTIFDSGTTLTLLDDSVYSKVKSAFSSRINLKTVDGSSAGFDLCYDVSKNKNYKFPSLSLLFTGVKFTPPQDNYFVLVDTANTVACLAMGGSGSLGLGIIGNLMQQNFRVLHDRSAGVITLSPAKCDSL